MNYQLDSVIEILLSADNQRRTQAERFIEEITSTNYNDAVDGFLHVMGNQNKNIASMGALLLKKKYLDVKDNLAKLSKDKLELIVTTVTSMMVPEKQLIFLKRCCEILVRIYSFMKADKELVQLINNMGNIEVLNVKLALMYFIEITCESAFNDALLINHSSSLITLFNKGFGDASNEVQVATFKTLTIFLSTIQEESSMKQFSPLLKNIVSKAIQLIKFDQESGISALQSLNQLIETHPKFTKPIFDDLLMIYSEIMETQQLLVNLRSTAMSGILTLCMNHHTLVRKSQHFKARMVPSYMKMLAEVDSTSLEEWAEELMDEQVSKHQISIITEEHLAQIANELGNKFMLPLFIPFIQQGIGSQEIAFQHAGLTAMALLIENCHESYKKELKSMVQLMLPLLHSENPRIIADILVAMGYMSTEFAPEIQINFGTMILEFICKAMKHPIMKVQYRAVLCIVNFQQGLIDHKDVKVIEPYLPTILADLGRIFEQALQSSNFIMLEAVLDSMSSIASINDFGPYYNTFMPGLKQVVSMVTSDTPQKVNIKSKTIETMGDLLGSIKENNDLFASQCRIIMESLMKLQSQLDKEDIMNRAVMAVYQNVVEVMKENFHIYSDFVFERAMDAALRPVDVQIIDELGKEKEGKKNLMHNYAKVKLDLKIDGIKNIVLNTDTFSQKIQGTNLLSAMAENMGPHFLKYADHMIKIIKELILIKYSKEMRANMVDCCKFLVSSGTSQQQKYAILTQIEESLDSALEKAIKFRDHDDVCSITEALSIMMPSMDERMKQALPLKMKAVMGMVSSLVGDIEKIYSEKDMDDDLTEEMNNQIEQVEESLQYVEEIVKLGKGIPAIQNLRGLFPKGYEFSE